MKLFKLFYVLIALVTIGFISSCTKDDDKDTTKTDTFNREVMLTSWADNIIIPSYQAFNADMNDLKEAADAFETAPNVVNLEALRRSWETAYVTWQNVSMFNIGPAETSFFRSFLNTYPTSTATINTNISTGAYNLQDINLNDAQGFPALDYLLFGLANTVKNGEDVSALINTQFNASRTAINSLNDSFSNQINTDNNAMLSAFEALQSNVVLLKSDMFSALSIAVEFNSGDGD